MKNKLLFFGLLFVLAVAAFTLQSFTPDDASRRYSGLYHEVDLNTAVSDGDVIWEGTFEKAVDIHFSVAIDSASSVLVQSSAIPTGGWVTSDTMTPTASAGDSYLLTDASGYIRLTATVSGTSKDIDFGIKVTDAQ